MTTIRVALAIALLCSATTYAGSMDAQGTASGNAVLYFSGTSATGTFISTFILCGCYMHVSAQTRAHACA